MHQVHFALFRQQARSPFTWAVLILAFISWPISMALTPLATSLSGGTTVHLAYNVAFLGLLTGVLFGDRRLEEYRWLLSRQSPSRVTLLSLLFLTSSSLLPAALCFLPMALLNGHVPSEAAVTLPLAAIHIAVIVQLLNSLGFSRSSRSVGILILALLLPASIPSDAGPFSFLWRLLDPLAGQSLGNASFGLISLQLGSIVTIFLLASALRVPIAK